MSSTKTTTELNASAGAGDSTRAEQKLGGENLPPPNTNINRDRADDLTAVVDLLAQAENEREVFTGQYKNADHLLKEYRETLRAVLEVDHDHREDAYRVLANAIFLHKKAHFQPVLDQMLDWARGGYNGEPPQDYFDANGNKRQMRDDDDPEYTRRTADADTEMGEDGYGLPEDMTFYEEKWKSATRYLQELFDTPRLYKDDKGVCRTHLDQINYDLQKKQQEDQCLDVNLTVPDFMLMYTLVHATEATMEANKAGSETEKVKLMEEPNRELALVKERIERAHQPLEWVQSLEQIVPEKAMLMEKHASNTTEYQGGWETDFLQSLKKYSEPFKEASEATSFEHRPGATAEHIQTSDETSGKSTNATNKPQSASLDADRDISAPSEFEDCVKVRTLPHQTMQDGEVCGWRRWGESGYRFIIRVSKPESLPKIYRFRVATKDEVDTYKQTGSALEIPPLHEVKQEDLKELKGRDPRTVAFHGIATQADLNEQPTHNQTLILFRGSGDEPSQPLRMVWGSQFESCVKPRKNAKATIREAYNLGMGISQEIPAMPIGKDEVVSPAPPVGLGTTIQQAPGSPLPTVQGASAIDARLDKMEEMLKMFIASQQSTQNAGKATSM